MHKNTKACPDVLRKRTSSADPRLLASKVSLPSMSANVVTTVAPVAFATRL